MTIMLLIIIIIIMWYNTVTKNTELKLLIQNNNILAEISNKNLEIIDKLEAIRINSRDVRKNTQFNNKK